MEGDGWKETGMGMSNDEVIKGIIHHKLKEKSMQELNHDECFDCPYRPDGKHMCESIEPLLDDALALLKEQEAKTITNKWHKNPLGDYSRLHCPWCDRELDIQSAKEYVACPYCGKAVKWE